MLPLLLALLATASAEPLPPGPDPEQVSAEADARARELFLNGTDLYDEGRYEDALVAWSEAWRLSGRPLLLYNMASAAERLARWDDAVDLLSRYRAYAPASERETLERRIRNVERRLAPSPLPLPDAHLGPKRGVPIVPVALFAVGGASLATGSVFAARSLDARAIAATMCTSVPGAVRCPESASGALASERTNALFADVAFGVGILAVGGGLFSALLPSESGYGVAVHVEPRGALVSVGGPLP